MAESGTPTMGGNTWWKGQQPADFSVYHVSVESGDPYHVFWRAARQQRCGGRFAISRRKPNNRWEIFSAERFLDFS